MNYLDATLFVCHHCGEGHLYHVGTLPAYRIVEMHYKHGKLKGRTLTRHLKYSNAWFMGNKFAIYDSQNVPCGCPYCANSKPTKITDGTVRLIKPGEL